MSQPPAAQTPETGRDAGTEHTPGKISLRPSGLLATDEGNVRFIAGVRAHGPHGELTAQDIADGERLALAWNSHDELFSACKEAEAWLAQFIEYVRPMGYGNDSSVLTTLRDAIANVPGGQR
jgi:hypothetical protein